MSASSSGEEKVTWVDYLAFVLTIVFFSGFSPKVLNGGACWILPC